MANRHPLLPPEASAPVACAALVTPETSVNTRKRCPPPCRAIGFDLAHQEFGEQLSHVS